MKKPQYIDDEFVRFDITTDPMLVDKVVNSLFGGKYKYYRSQFLYPSVGENFWKNIIEKTFQDYLYKHNIHLVINEDRDQLRYYVQQYINSLVGVYDNVRFFIDFIEKDMAGLPKNLIDYDTIYSSYEYLQILGIGIAVLKKLD